MTKEGKVRRKKEKMGCWELFIFNWVSLPNVALIIINGLKCGTKNLWQKRGKVRIKKKGVGENFGSVQAAPEGTLHIAGRLGRRRQAEVGWVESAEPVLMQRAAAPCTLRIVHCAPAPLSGRALCITDRVRETLQRSAGRILMQQHYLVKICINMAELWIVNSCRTFTSRYFISRSAKNGKNKSSVKGP